MGRPGQSADCPVEAWVKVSLQRLRPKLWLFVSRVNTRADKIALWGNEGEICENGNV
jgi:hypothetical protein